MWNLENLHSLCREIPFSVYSYMAKLSTQSHNLSYNVVFHTKHKRCELNTRAPQPVGVCCHHHLECFYIHLLRFIPCRLSYPILVSHTYNLHFFNSSDMCKTKYLLLLVIRSLLSSPLLIQTTQRFVMMDCLFRDQLDVPSNMKSRFSDATSTA
jgi:hypothetical protein